jgi:long-chain fatty acid transport protein
VQSVLAVVNEHRVTAGIGFCDLVPGIDIDLFAGGMFEGSHQSSTGAISSSVESYWIGAGLTWRFGAGRSSSGS